MSEKLEVYDLNSELIGIEDRKKFYDEAKKEFEKSGKVSKQLKRVNIIMMNSTGRIYLQKRSKIKKENPGVYDKTIGGHVSAGDSWNMTVIRECAEELGFPSSILDEEEFKKAVKVSDTSIVGIFKKIDQIDAQLSTRQSVDGKEFVQPYITAFYIGYFDGPIKFVDGESSGIEVFSIDELKEEIQDKPDKFTEDVKFMVEKYEKFLVPIE